MNTHKLVLSTRMEITLVTVMIVSGISITLPTLAADAKDHPVISRYEGSEITNYNEDTFNEYALFIDKAGVSGGADKNPAAVTVIEGKVTEITYRNPAERTTLEVFRNYQNAMTEAGFDLLFTCKNAECGGYKFNGAITKIVNLIGSYGDQRYLAGKLSRSDGDIYVSLYVAMANVGGGADFKRVITQLHVIEVENMQENMVTVDAAAMARGIGEEGRIALYGIGFDHDLAIIKSGSKPTLEQIAALLNDNPDLELVIVGHTDNQGSLEYNMDLSKRRAKAVEAALTGNYAIPQSRLSSWGAGYLSPVATNRSDAGRAKNRRVELVEK